MDDGERELRELRTDELDPAARGRAAGAALGGEIEAVVASYERLFDVTRGLSPDDLRRFGDRVLQRVADWHAPIVAEFEGLAEGAGIAVETVAMMNARTELTAVPECTLVAVLDAADGPFIAQNWDWYTDAPERCVLWNLAGASGTRFLTMTEAGLLAKVGVSAGRVAVGLNILHHVRDGGARVGVPIHVLLRQLLSDCATVADADGLLREAPLSASSAVTVVDAHGDGAVFELSPAGVRRIEPDRGLLVHTNHFLEPALVTGEGQTLYLLGSRDRLAAARRMRPADEEAARAVLARHGTGAQDICRHSEHEGDELPAVGTVVSLVMRPAAGTLAVAAGPPCQTPFREYAV
jgi:isopenicillin-N N-acyltransferase like protein